MTHTPGPWTVNDGDMIWGPNEEFIAECIHEPYEANAALIAAAPDLLAVCEQLLIVAENFSHNRPNSTGHVLACYEAARTFIARAKGD
jgi:hypothetical protein